MVNIPEVNIGNEVKRVMDAKGLSSVSLARTLKMGPSGLSRLLVKPFIDAEQLIAISRALDFNFFSLYAASTSLEEQGKQLQQRVATLEDDAKKKDARIADLEERLAWAKTVLDAIKKK